MKIKHPTTGDTLTVPDKCAPEWLALGWLKDQPATPRNPETGPEKADKKEAMK